MENFLPFTDEFMVALVHKCVQQAYLLALHIPRLLGALNGFVYFLIIVDPSGENPMVGSIFRNLLTELGIRTKDAECNLIRKMLILRFSSYRKSCVGKYHPRQVINTPVIKMIQPV